MNTVGASVIHRQRAEIENQRVGTIVFCIKNISLALALIGDQVINPSHSGAQIQRVR